MATAIAVVVIVEVIDWWWVFVFLCLPFPQVQSSITGRFVYFQMINIFATIVGGGIVTQFKSIVQDPSNIIAVLGCTMPDVAVYFIQVSE